MQARYQSLSPYNLVRIILGERKPSDNDTDNIYTRAAGYLRDWIARGVLEREARPSVYAYFQEFTVPDTGEKLVRKGFIGLGAVEPYSENIVFRHEQTLSGPKKDRLELLRHTHAHFGQIFMLYPDPAGEIDTLLDEVAAGRARWCHQRRVRRPAQALADRRSGTYRTDPAAHGRQEAAYRRRASSLRDGTGLSRRKSQDAGRGQGHDDASSTCMEAG